MNPPKKLAWALAVASLLGLTSSMALLVYLERSSSETPVFDAIKGLLFWGESGEPVMRAPPLINLSQLNTLRAWAGLTAIIAVASLVRAGMARHRLAPTQSRAAAVVISLLTLYCLWHAWPLLEQRIAPAGGH